MTTSTMIGIIAGEGQLPHDIALKVQAMGREPVILYLGNDLGLQKKKWYERWKYKVSSIGDVQKSLDFLKAHDVQEVLFAGRVKRPNLLKFRPDALGAKWLVRLLPCFGRDDALLRKVAELFSEKGLIVLNPANFLPKEQIPEEIFCWGESPSQESLEDISIGCAVLQDLSPHDVGQSIVVREGRVYGIEAVEGTDELLSRVSTYREEGQKTSGVLVKMAKTIQDKRLDQPVIGPKTIEGAIKAGLSGVALQAGAVILIQPDQVRKMAEDSGIFVTTFTI